MSLFKETPHIQIEKVCYVKQYIYEFNSDFKIELLNFSKFEKILLQGS